MVTTGSLLVDLIGVVVAVVCMVITYYKWTYGYWKRKGFQYFEPKFPFGNMQNTLKKDKLAVGQLMQNYYEEAKSKGWKHCGMYLMASPSYMVLDPKYVKNIMLKDFNYFVDRGLYVNEKTDPMGAHLFAIGGSKWRNLRRKLTPTFTSGKMKMMFKALVDCGQYLEETMEELIDKKEPVDIKEVLGRFTTDNIGSCAFGLECNTFKEPDSPFRVYGKKVFHPNRLRQLKRNFSNNFPTIAKALSVRQIPADISDFFTKVVKDTVEYREKNKVVRKDFLQLLMEIKSDDNEYRGDGNTLTINEIIAQCFVFFIAGFETSSTTMTFCLFELAQNQEIQDRVREEINEVLKKHNGEITYDAINEMKYMGQVIDETLRKYPPVPFVTRTCVEDYKVPDADLIIEKGTRVIIPIQGIHYDEEYYPEPKKFDPERFNEENKHKRDQFTYLPFGEGNRMCIGMRFGIMQIKVGLAVLLRKYKFVVNNKTKVPIKMASNSFVWAADGGIWLDCQRV